MKLMHNKLCACSTHEHLGFNRKINLKYLLDKSVRSGTLKMEQIFIINQYKTNGIPNKRKQQKTRNKLAQNKTKQNAFIFINNKIKKKGGWGGWGMRRDKIGSLLCAFFVDFLFRHQGKKGELQTDHQEKQYITPSCNTLFLFDYQDNCLLYDNCCFF